MLLRNIPLVRSGVAIAAACLGATTAMGIGQNYWDFEPGQDPYTSNAVFDFRSMNESEAGVNGFVTASDDGRFLLGDGTPVRFWTINAGVPADTDEMMRFFAKRGVNLVRWHTSVYNNSAPNFGDTQRDRIDGLHRFTNSAREQGIYVSVSGFFILGLRIQPEWGVDGWTQQWMDENPAKADSAPFALQFWDEDFKDAMKEWYDDIFTSPNNFHPQRTTLADDPTIAFVEIQNEDNLFFWTFDTTEWPDESRFKAEEGFHDWLMAKYGTEQAILDAWGGGNFTRGFQSVADRDDYTLGRVGVGDAFMMTSGGATGSNDRLRMADQILYLAEVQYDFYAEFASYMRNALGVKSLFSASNWRTADNTNLLDLEHYTYTAAGIIDVHNYFGAIERTQANNNFVSGGDQYLSIPNVSNPRRLPATYKHVLNHPAFQSESTWTQPFDYKSEGPPLITAYAALSDHDGWTWFATGDENWHNDMGRWPVAIPSLLGIFPGSVNMYRRGDVAEAPIVVLERRNLQDIAEKNTSLITTTPGWDPTRDPSGQFDYDPANNQGLIDSLAFQVGKVAIEFENGDEDFVSPLVEEHIDYENQTVSSVTGELMIDFGNGLFTVDTDRTQGAAGFTDANGRIEMSDIAMRVRNEFASVMVTSLDNMPIAQSTELLVTVGTREYLTGHDLEDIEIDIGTRNEPDIRIGKVINAVGTWPWRVEMTDGYVDFTTIDISRVTSIDILDPNGYATGETITPSNRPSGFRANLPEEAMFMRVALSAPTDLKPEIITKALQNGDVNEPFSQVVETISGDGEVTFTASNLPSGLSIAANGTVSGTPTEGGIFYIDVTATDADGDTDLQSVLLQLLPLDAAPAAESIFGPPTTTDLGDGFKWNEQIGFMYDALYPFVYLFDSNDWIWVYDVEGVNPSETDGFYFWRFGTAHWGWTQAAFYPFYPILDGSNTNGNLTE